MSPSSLPHDESEIADLRRRLQLLARQLVADDGRADDIVQDAWLAALQAPRTKVRDFGGWLAGAVRHLALRGYRRERSERAAQSEWGRARAGALAEKGTEDVHERGDSVQLLHSTTARLREPYREVIYLRFFEECSAREISVRLERPLKTVQSQIQRGLDLMRASLDREFEGQRGGWSALLVASWKRTPVERSPEATGATGATGGPRPAGVRRRAPAHWARVGALVAAVGGGALWLGNAGGAGASGQPLRPTLAPAGAARGERARAPSRAAPDERRPAPVPSRPAPETATIAPATLLLRVVDAAGRPVPGAQVRFGSDREVLLELTCDDGGLLRHQPAGPLLGVLPLETAHPRGVVLVALAPGLARSDDLYVGCPPGESELTLALPGPGFDLAGFVRDEEGRPISGAEVSARDRPLQARRLTPDAVAVAMAATTYTDEEGRYELAGLRANATVEVHIETAGFAKRVLTERSGGERLQRDYVLSPGARIEGRVLRAGETGAWAGAAGARVWVDSTRGKGADAIETTAGADGEFVLSGLGDGTCVVFAQSAEDPTLGAHTVLAPTLQQPGLWEARLERRAPLAMRFLGSDSQPMRRASVVLGGTVAGVAWRRTRLADGDGRVRFHTVTDAPMRANVFSVTGLARAASDLVLQDLRASEGEQVFRVGGEGSATCALRGELITERDEPVAGVLLYAYNLEQGLWRNSVPADELGEFALTGLFRGSHALYLVGEQGCLPMGEIELAPGELHLGTVRAPPVGGVRLAADSRAGSLQLVAPVPLPSGTRFPLLVRLIDAPWNGSIALWPGDYSLVDPGRGSAQLFRVEAGEQSEVSLD